jgi:mRNA-degrading endonuclease toxin of MazEF toxin-antitoxin module
VLCDQMRSLDVRARNYAKVGSLSDADTTEIIRRIEMLIEKE